MSGPLLVALVAGQVALARTSGPSLNRLAVHLVDEGFDLVPAGTPTNVSLLVDTSTATFLVEVRGARIVRHSIDGTPRAVAELELLQRAVLALREAGASRSASPSIPLAVIQQPASLTTELRGRVILATLDAGYGITRTATNAVAAICIEEDGRRVGVSVRDDPCVATSTSSAAALAARLRQLLDEALEEKSPPREEPIAPVTAAPERWRLAARGAGGATGRASAIDPLVSIGSELAFGAFGGRLDAVFAFASGGEVQALEILALGGPTWSRHLVDWLRFEIALRLGVQLHRYEVEGSPSGTHADFTADLPLSLSLELGSFAIEFSVVPGLSNRARRHERDEEVLWSRGLARLLLTLGGSLSFGL
jgi:hypothetical protein